MFTCCLIPNCSGPPAPKSKNIEIFTPDLDKDQYAFKIKQLNEIAENDQYVEIRSKAHFKLALLYLSYKNPDQNYALALAHLRTYMSMTQDSKSNYEAQNWSKILQHLEEIKNKYNQQYSQLSSQIQTLAQQIKEINVSMSRSNRKLSDIKKEKQRLMSENQALSQKNEELRQTIEKLRKLDLRVEEKRRIYK